MPGAVPKKEGTWSSDASFVHVRANMEDPLWVSRVVGGRGSRARDNRDKGLDGAQKTGTTLPVGIRTVSVPLYVPKTVSIYMAGRSGKERGLEW